MASVYQNELLLLPWRLESEGQLSMEGQSPGRAAQGGPGVSLSGAIPSPAGHVPVLLLQGILPGQGVGLGEPQRSLPILMIL